MHSASTPVSLDMCQSRIRHIASAYTHLEVQEYLHKIGYNRAEYDLTTSLESLRDLMFRHILTFPISNVGQH